VKQGGSRGRADRKKGADKLVKRINLGDDNELCRARGLKKRFKGGGEVEMNSSPRSPNEMGDQGETRQKSQM